MKTFPVLFVFFFIALPDLRAQVIDDFSDGDFTANPSWNGSTHDFIVNASGQLQLNASAAGKSWMYTDFQVNPDQKTAWEFYVKQSFAPSGANFGRFYLMTDETDLSGPLNGYFLQFGESGSADAIELFKQSGTALTSVCRASAGAIASAFAVRLRVTRENNGDWQLLIAPDGTSTFIAEASGRDAEHQVGHFTGPLCTYTITNATRFYYDDFYFSTVNASDFAQPVVRSAEVMTPSSLRVTFSEEMDSASMSNPLMYFITESSSHPETVERHTDARTVTLSFPDDFRNGYQHTLEIHGMTDLAGNAMADTAIVFVFFEPQPVHFKDIIFTEILADPSPTVALPEAEFVELYNRGSHPVDLSGWTVSDGNTSAPIGHFVFLPEAYLVLTSAAEKFHASANVIDVSLPSLNNSGDIIKLIDPDGIIVDSLVYSDSWYTDDASDGGWSLELIDPENICAGAQNWTVSESTLGGTPGQDNSVKASLPDNTGPVVLSVVPSDSVTLNIAFNEALDTQIPPVDYFQIQPVRRVLSVRFMDASLTEFALVVDTPLQRGETYTITIVDVYDCSGNPLQQGTSSSQFVIPQKAKKSDVIINEILFNPMPQGVDFVEVYNRSDKVIDLRNWLLANPHNETGSTTVMLPETLSIIYPGEYRVFTEDEHRLKSEYIGGDERAFRQTNLPALNDDEGRVVLRDDAGGMIDSVFYSEEYHNPFVRDGEGISLERISAFSAGVEDSNWRSASAETGFATPGYANSNSRTGQLSGEAVTVEPEVIQPDVNALSFALIKYQFEKGGFMANVMIMDQQGRPVRKIASNELLGAHGFFRWDGDLENGSAANVGYYMVRFEVFDAAGMVHVIRKRLAIF